MNNILKILKNHKNYRILFIGQQFAVLASWAYFIILFHIFYDKAPDKKALFFGLGLVAIPTLLLNSKILASNFLNHKKKILCAEFISLIITIIITLAELSFWNMIPFLALINICTTVSKSIKQSLSVVFLKREELVSINSLECLISGAIMIFATITSSYLLKNQGVFTLLICKSALLSISFTLVVFINIPQKQAINNKKRNEWKKFILLCSKKTFLPHLMRSIASWGLFLSTYKVLIHHYCTHKFNAPYYGPSLLISADALGIIISSCFILTIIQKTKLFTHILHPLSGIIRSLLLILFVLNDNFILGLFLFFLMGLCNSVNFTLKNTLLQKNLTAEEYLLVNSYRFPLVQMSSLLSKVFCTLLFFIYDLEGIAIFIAIICGAIYSFWFFALKRNALSDQVEI